MLVVTIVTIRLIFPIFVYICPAVTILLSVFIVVYFRWWYFLGFVVNFYDIRLV
jgi:hypothetical protein